MNHPDANPVKSEEPHAAADTPAGSSSTSDTSGPFSPADSYSSSSTGRLMPHESTTEHIEYLSRVLATALQEKKFGNHWIFTHFDPAVKSNTHFNEKEYVTGLQRYLEEPQRYLAMFPEMECVALEPFDVSVDERAGRATVYVTFEVSGAPPGITRQNMAVIDWKLGKEKWMIVKMTGIRGFGDVGLP